MQVSCGENSHWKAEEKEECNNNSDDVAMVRKLNCWELPKHCVLHGRKKSLLDSLGTWQYADSTSHPSLAALHAAFLRCSLLPFFLSTTVFDQLHVSGGSKLVKRRSKSGTGFQPKSQRRYQPSAHHFFYTFAKELCRVSCPSYQGWLEKRWIQAANRCQVKIKLHCIHNEKTEIIIQIFA